MSALDVSAERTSAGLNINQIETISIRERLRNLEPSIQGEYGSGRLWAACKMLQECGVDAYMAFELLLADFNPRCLPSWSHQELAYSLARAYNCDPVTGGTSSLRWPVPEPDLRYEIVEKTGIRMEDFRYWRPSPCETPCPGFFLDELFPNTDPFLCLGWDPKHFATKPKSLWQGNLNGIQLMVPNTMTAPTGKPKGLNYETPRALSNTGARRFLVVEFDLAEYNRNGTESPDAPFIREMARRGLSIKDINASLIAHLASKGPLAMAMSSGGKSVHAWFFVEGVQEATIRAFFAYACRLGADRHMWTPCQAARLPDGMRDNGEVQSVLYFDSEVLS